jgi:hypothetical protein
LAWRRRGTFLFVGAPSIVQWTNTSSHGDGRALWFVRRWYVLLLVEGLSGEREGGGGGGVWGVPVTNVGLVFIFLCFCAMVAVIGVQETASLIALTSFYNKHYGTCSKAFINLESQKGLPQAVLDKYIELGVNIFSRHPPQDPDSKAVPLLDTSRMACVASGRPLIGSDSTITCRSCSHKMFSREVTGTYCPLCHAKLEYSGR